jgi:CubicO group peptidase (beta-lactamase class C family)
VSRQLPRVIATLVVAAHAALATGAGTDDLAGRIDALLELYQRNGQFDGAALVADGGRLVLKKGYGLANREWQVSNAPDTRFRLGSITKQFTAALALQQVEKGTLRLDGTISDYLPGYRSDVGGKVTIHHLLTHTSGIPSYTAGPAIAEIGRDPHAVADFVKTYCSGDLQFEPGSRFAYNNSGYFLLGAILERATGRTYEQLLRERVLDPLGMKDTGYDHHETVLARRAGGYEKTLTGGYRNAPYLDMSVPYAAGSLYSTVEDLFRWDQSLYTDGVLSARSREVMFKPFLQDYAYGWAVRRAAVTEPDAGALLIAHEGGINGFNTLLQRLVDRRGLIVLLNNTGGAPLGAMAAGIRAVLAGKEYARPRLGIAEVVAPVLMEKGAAAAVERYRALKASDAERYDFAEGQLNRLGYELLALGRVSDAITVFELNVEAYPEASNTYDSLGEAYLKAGEKELARDNYRKSLALNKDNANAAEVLKTLP